MASEPTLWTQLRRLIAIADEVGAGEPDDWAISRNRLWFYWGRDDRNLDLAIEQSGNGCGLSVVPYVRDGDTLTEVTETISDLRSALKWVRGWGPCPVCGGEVATHRCLGGYRVRCDTFCCTYLGPVADTKPAAVRAYCDAVKGGGDETA